MQVMKKDWLYLIAAFLISCTIFYGYYFFTKESKLDIVYKNWDGPSYILAAISLYDPQVAYDNNFINSGDIRPDWTWLPAHFPLYPLLIRSVASIGVGYFQSMLLVSVMFTLFAYLAMYELLKYLKISKYPLLLTLPFIYLSPRWFTVSHVGGTESMFLFFVIMFLLYVAKGRHTVAALYIGLAQLTRPHAAFFGIGMAIIALVQLIRTRDLRTVVRTYYPYLIMPVAILAIFSFYRLQTGNFWAFFDAISLTKNLQSIPFRTFSFPASNIETFWQEVNAYDYVLYLGAALFMFKKKLWQFGVIALTFFIPLIFLQHSDISRYAIPLLPFAFIAYSEVIEKKEFTWATILMSPAIMMYAINFMDHNHGA
jgi:Gpi18-like mannosyltransferase